MKALKNISVVILSAVFLASASGILIFHTHCICSGNKQVSVYVSPETCDENFHIHHSHNEGSEAVCTAQNDCHDCNPAGGDGCGCSAPDVKYLKLESQVVNEKVRIEKLQPARLKMLQAAAFFLFNFNIETEKTGFGSIDPPPRFTTSTDFLIQIHQLKIPVQA